MAEQLQALLDRINEQGIEKAEAEREEILSKARDEAKRIVSEAEEKAAKTVSDAESEADLLVKKGEESLKQAARKVLLSLREELCDRMAAVARECLAGELSGDRLAGAVEVAAKAYMSGGGKADSVEVLVPEEQREVVAKHVLAALADDFRKEPSVSPAPDVSAGFRLVFDGSDAQYDFSDEALLDVFRSFLNPKLAELVAGSKSEG
jgi:V/A-type H+-transporting ATPase subunit E